MLITDYIQHRVDDFQVVVFDILILSTWGQETVLVLEENLLKLVFSIIGAKLIEAREGIVLRKGEEHDSEFLKQMFDGYCPVKTIPYEENPFFTCMERAGLHVKVT